MSQSLLAGERYQDEDWPHGLSCGQCRHIFREPERYAKQPDAFLDGTLLTKLVCLACSGLLEGR